MRARHDSFLEVFRAPNPLESDDFRVLCDKVGATSDSKLLQEFLLALNRDLVRRVESGAEGDVTWAVNLCVALSAASHEAMVSGLGALVNDGALWFHDPLIAVAFEAASQAPPLLELLADLVDTESYLLQFRVRAMEALVTRSPGTVDADAVGLEAQSALRFLNAIFEELDRGAGQGRRRVLRALVRGLCRAQSPLSRDRRRPGGARLGRGGARRARRGADRVRKHADGAAHPAHQYAAAVLALGPPAAGRDGGRSSAVGALIVDKAIQVVLATSGARWRASWVSSAAPRAPRQTVELWPFNERVLEAALADPTKPPRVRAAAAGLLRVLTAASPAVQPSLRAELYAELFLAPYRRTAPRGATAEESRAPRFRGVARSPARRDERRLPPHPPRGHRVV